MTHCPDYLYHYTSINTLGLILKNRNIRFNNLTALDDLDERRQSGGNYGKYCFISSWTDKREDNISMWKMYSDDMKGVCIKMRSHPFVEHEIDAQDIGNNRLFAGGRIGESGKIKSLVLLEELYNSNYMFYLRDNSRLLYKVEYNDLTYLEQFKQSSILEKFDNGIISLNGNLLGKVKNNFWKFQQEWRYILLIYPLDPDAMNDKERYLNELNRIQKLEDLHSEGKPLTDYFLTLKDEALETMEIQLGPKTNDIDEEIVSLLLKKYNPTAADNISKSDLQGRV